MIANKISFGTRTNFSAVGAVLASHIRTDFNHINPPHIGFVGDEALQLIETPSTKPEIKLLAFPNLSYSFKVLQYDSVCNAVIHNLFTDNMVPVSLETPLPSRNLFKQFLGGSCAFALEPCSQPFEFESVSLNFIPTKELLVACYSDMVYSDINTNLKSVRNLVDVDVSGKCYVQEHSVFFINNNRGCLWTPVKVFPVIFRNVKRDFNSSFDSCEPYLVKAETECSLVEIKRHNFLKGWFRAFVGLDAFKGLRSYPISVDNELRRKFKLFSCFVVAEMMKFVPVVYLFSKAFICDVRNCFTVSLHGLKKQFVRFNFEFNSCYRLHKDSKGLVLYKLYGHICPVRIVSPPTTEVMGIRNGGIL